MSPSGSPLLIARNLRISRNQYKESDASKGWANTEGPSCTKWIIWYEKASAGMAAKWQATGMSSSHLRVGLGTFCLGKNTNALMHRDIELLNLLQKSSGGVGADTEVGHLTSLPDPALNSYGLSYGWKKVLTLWDCQARESQSSSGQDATSTSQSRNHAETPAGNELLIY